MFHLTLSKLRHAISATDLSRKCMNKQVCFEKKYKVKALNKIYDSWIMDDHIIAEIFCHHWAKDVQLAWKTNAKGVSINQLTSPQFNIYRIREDHIIAEIFCHHWAQSSRFVHRKALNELRKTSLKSSKDLYRRFLTSPQKPYRSTCV